MGITYLILIIFQVVSIAAIATLWVRITKIQNQEDQRLSKGLQLLQSKLAVLEDLSDRTEIQVNQLIAILESKIKDIQSKLIDADKVVSKIDKNIAKSLEVANIFQDKIPHQEILERQYTKKYVKAAQMAHSGSSAEDIAQTVDLTHGEIELIMKLNRQQLQFEVSELPEWAKQELSNVDAREVEMNIPTIYESKTEKNNTLMNLESAFEVPKVDNQNLKKLGDQFRSVMASTPSAATPTTQIATQRRVPEINNSLMNTFSQFFDAPVEAKQEMPSEVIVQGGKTMNVKPFQFKRIDDDANL